VLRRNPNGTSQLLLGKSSARLLRSALVDNGYGVVLQGQSTAEHATSLLSDNAIANVASDTGLVVVEPPNVVHNEP